MPKKHLHIFATFLWSFISFPVAKAANSDTESVHSTLGDDGQSEDEGQNWQGGMREERKVPFFFAYNSNVNLNIEGRK